MSRTTITVDDDVKERLDAQKRDGESYSAFQLRLLDALATVQALESQDSGVNSDANPLTVDDVTYLKREIADEVEGRLSRR